MASGELLRVEAVLPGNASWELDAVNLPRKGLLSLPSGVASIVGLVKNKIMHGHKGPLGTHLVIGSPYSLSHRR